MSLARKIVEVAARWLRALLVAAPPSPPEVRHEDRLDLALKLLAGGGITMTLLAGYLAYRLAERGAVWQMFYLAAGALILIGIVLTTYGYMLGRKGLQFEATKDGIRLVDGGTQ